jgi:hypothetical protein
MSVRAVRGAARRNVARKAPFPDTDHNARVGSDVVTYRV